MNQEKEREISLQDFKRSLKEYFKYLLSKSSAIIIVAVLFAFAGVVYAWLQKPVYKAELTYATVNEKSGAGNYLGLASQLGIDLGSDGGIFEGESLTQLLKSRLLVQKTFLTPVLIKGQNELLVNYYIKINKSNKTSEDSLRHLLFEPGYNTGIRAKDSLLKKFCDDITDKALSIEKADKKIDIFSVTLTSNDEFFAKSFVEQLVNNAIQYYVDYKIKKAKQNVEILQRQTDSVRNLITGNIVSIAVSNDLNVNPSRQIMRTGTQRKQVDVQVNSALYSELVKNLELSRMNLRKETPLIQIIDVPILPLEKKKMGILHGAFLFGVAGLILAIVIFFFKRLLDL